MGEAKLRAEHRRDTLAAGRPEPQHARQVQKFRERVLDIPALLDDALQVEWKKFLESVPGMQVTYREYIVALLEAATERERQAREAAEQKEKDKDRLVVEATHVPFGMAEAAARLRALKRGAV